MGKVLHPHVASAVGSVRAEGLEPGEDVIALLEARAQGLVSDEQLESAKRAIKAGESVDRFVPAAAR